MTHWLGTHGKLSDGARDRLAWSAVPDSLRAQVRLRLSIIHPDTLLDEWTTAQINDAVHYVLPTSTSTRTQPIPPPTDDDHLEEIQRQVWQLAQVLVVQQQQSHDEHKLQRPRPDYGGANSAQYDSPRSSPTQSDSSEADEAQRLAVIEEELRALQARRSSRHQVYKGGQRIPTTTTAPPNPELDRAPEHIVPRPPVYLQTVDVHLQSLVEEPDRLLQVVPSPSQVQLPPGVPAQPPSLPPHLRPSDPAHAKLVQVVPSPVVPSPLVPPPIVLAASVVPATPLVLDAEPVVPQLLMPALTPPPFSPSSMSSPPSPSSSSSPSLSPKSLVSNQVAFAQPESESRQSALSGSLYQVAVTQHKSESRPSALSGLLYYSPHSPPPCSHPTLPVASSCSQPESMVEHRLAPPPWPPPSSLLLSDIFLCSL